jgi:hypothetical protein
LPSRDLIEMKKHGKNKAPGLHFDGFIIEMPLNIDRERRN